MAIVDYNDPRDLPPIDYDRNKVPKAIKDRADGVREAKYGKQNKEFLAQNSEISGIYAGEAKRIAERTQIRQDAVEDLNAQVIQEMTDKDVISAPEIIQARAGEDTLNARLVKLNQLISDVDVALSQVHISITKMGAKGDYSTDSIGAINSAIDYVSSQGGGVVYIPTGVYKVIPTSVHSIVMKDNVSLIGSGASVIKVSDDNPDFDYLISGVNSSLKNSIFRGIDFDTNAEGNSQGSYSNAHVNRRIIIHILLADYIKILDCKFYYSAVNAVILTGAMYNNKHNIIANNDFVFTPVGAVDYDNTCLYLGTIGFMVYGNHFKSPVMIGDQSKARALTAVEMHSSYSMVTNNIFDNFESPMLITGADYLEQNENPYEVTQKVVSGNIFRRCLHAITFWADQDIYNTNINNNIIYVNNIERTNHVVDAYGIAFCHAGVFGGAFSGSIKHTLINDNQIYFQRDDNALNLESYRNISRVDMSSFGIGSRSISGETVKIEDALISNNLIVNSPGAPISFQNTTTDVPKQYRDILVKNNKIHNPVSHGVITPLHRCAFFVYGRNIADIKFEDNEIVDNRAETFLVQELFVYSDGGLSNIVVKGNSFNTKNVVQEKEKYPTNPLVVTDDARINRAGVFNQLENVLPGSVLYASTGITYATDTGTPDTTSVSVSGTWENNVITLTNQSDIDKFRGGNFIQVLSPTDELIEFMVQIRGLNIRKGQIITHVTTPTQRSVKVRLKVVGTKKLVTV